ncbi:hypothetical protein [Halalkalibacter oceani]|uniref:Uncharacterized protein n=1 Tax=Halalkalibacter oceani TaxID=1653776 RepID=A0A9X2DMZ3_9BACI|nr:hypothetical protein [Halalkalibacter oceani]MCM3713639.1 hypothetical protein [Halalkalibacter oceani]
MSRKVNDQADGLRQQMKKHESETASLPPRSEVHKNRPKPIKLKLSFPLVRLLLILFFIIVVLVLSIPYWLQ